LLLAGTCLWLTGCGDRPRESTPAPPELEPARAALVASLEAWKSGHHETGALIGSDPAIATADVQRFDRPLLDFTIVGPLSVRGPARSFAVHLVLDSPREPVDTRYVVLGEDPLWVFGHDDYERILHWEHKMDDTEDSSGQTAPVSPPRASEGRP
jgi:hypothetical protein